LKIKGFLVLLLALSLALWTKAQFLYTTNNDSVTITGYTGSNDPVVIPDTLDGFPVVAIGDFAFDGCTATNILISSNVVSLGWQAFERCYSLTAIDIPDSITNIGDLAFSGCTNLSNVAIGSNVVSIGEFAFDDCTRLAAVFVPGNVAVIGTFAFQLCSGLTNVLISNGLGSIADNMFAGCGKLNSISIPNSVTNIGAQAFAGCRNLSNLIIPSSVINIGEGAFEDCLSLSSIEIPQNVSSIGESVFTTCLNLTNISVSPDNLSYGSSNGILFDKSLATLLVYPGGLKGNFTVPNAVTNIGDGAFLGCVDLTNVTIPESIVHIGTSAFAACPNLNNISVSKDNGQYSSAGGVLFNRDRTTLLVYPQGKTGGYAIPHSVTDIGSNAFGNCVKLSHITIPKGVLSIESGAFSSCLSLAEISIPEGVTNIGYNAFMGCGLKGITLPSSITEISSGMLEGCRNLANITIPNGVGSIDGFAFALCGNLRSVVIPDSVTNIGNNAFGTCGHLTNIIIPASVIRIEGSAFFGGRLMNAFFLGNPPDANNLFLGVNPGTVYYLPSSTGWSNTYCGWPTVSATSGTVTVSASPANGGRVAGVSGTFPPGSTVTVSAVAKNGFAFVNWTQNGNVVSSAADYTFMMFDNTDLQANFVDIVPPRLVVLFPGVKQRASTATIAATGRASDNVNVVGVYYQLNQGDWTTASGTTNWVAPNLQLDSGSNRLSVYAVDDAGNCSKTNNVVFFEGTK
jgi:hypothetical protein